MPDIIAIINRISNSLNSLKFTIKYILEENSKHSRVVPLLYNYFRVINIFMISELNNAL